MRVRIKKTSPQAVVPFKHYPEDFCYDCVATSCEEIAPNVYKYDLGIALQVDRNHQNPFALSLTTEGSLLKRIYEAWQLSIDARPRSSVWKTGMVLSNCEGTIDELFRGEISAVFYHVLPSMPRYKVGDRVVQIKLGFTLPMEFEQVDELDDTSRGTNGYGSTGN